MNAENKKGAPAAGKGVDVSDVCAVLDRIPLSERTPTNAPTVEALTAGLNSKEAWWAGARAGLGLPADAPRAEVADALAALTRQPVAGDGK